MKNRRDKDMVSLLIWSNDVRLLTIECSFSESHDISSLIPITMKLLIMSVLGTLGNFNIVKLLSQGVG